VAVSKVQPPSTLRASRTRRAASAPVLRVSTLQAASTFHATCALQAPTSFELFPKPPSEIRLKILEDACPKGDVILKVHATFHHSDPEAGMYLTFKVRPESRASRAFGLLSACMMSRQVYFKLNPHFLPGGSKSKIFYNAKDTIVFIENFSELIANARFAEGVRSRYWKQAWFKTIQNLAVPFDFFKGSNRRLERFCWEGHLALPRVMLSFANLEHLIGVVPEEDYGDLHFVGYLTRESQKLYLAHETSSVQETLDKYYRLWKISKVLTVHLIDA
jgi:hypothetical protein